jgi:hypothetical protein
MMNNALIRKLAFRQGDVLLNDFSARAEMAYAAALAFPRCLPKVPSPKVPAGAGREGGKRMMGNRMPQKSRNRKLARALCAAFGLTLAIASSTAAFAGDDSDDNDLWDAKIMKKFLRGFGLRNGQEAGIEYKERPPLVVPSSRDLPPPVTANSPSANNPAWPTDPDDQKRAEMRRVKRERKSVQNLDTGAGGADGNALKPGELEAGRTNQPGAKTGDLDKSPEMTPSQLGWTSSMWSGMVGLGKTFTGDKVVETSTFVHEPTRNALTDPPAGYRTPSPVQPYGINSKPSRSKTDIDRQTETVK